MLLVDKRNRLWLSPAMKPSKPTYQGPGRIAAPSPIMQFQNHLDAKQARGVENIARTMKVLSFTGLGIACIPGIGLVMWGLCVPLCLLIVVLSIILMCKGATGRGLWGLASALIFLPTALVLFPLVINGVLMTIEGNARNKRIAQETSAATAKKTEEAAAKASANAKVQLDAQKQFQSAAQKWLEKAMPGRDAAYVTTLGTEVFSGCRWTVITASGNDAKGERQTAKFVLRAEGGGIEEGQAGVQWLSQRESEVRRINEFSRSREFDAFKKMLAD